MAVIWQYVVKIDVDIFSVLLKKITMEINYWCIQKEENFKRSVVPLYAFSFL